MRKKKRWTQENLLKEYLRKISINLHEWSSLLYYSWLVVGSKKLSFDRGGKLEVIDTIFPPEYDWYDKVREASRYKANIVFEKDAAQFFKDRIDCNYTDLYFHNEPLKEFVLSFWLQNSEYDKREDLPMDNKNSFNVSSFEHRCLSILYRNFYQYQNVLAEIRGEDLNFLYELDMLREDVTRDASELISHWRLKHTGIRASLKGGRSGTRVKTKRGIILAIKKVLKSEGNLTRKKLWQYFEAKHNLIDNQPELEIDDYWVYFQRDRLVQQTVSTGKEVSIGKEAFFKYVTKINR